MINSGMMSSATDMWATPQSLFNELNERFGFTLDVCASHDNAKCKVYYTKEQDGLSQEWSGVCWMNPPYGRTIGQWVKKAYETAKEGHTVVALLPARTDTRWFHDWIYTKSNTSVEFLKGRVKFGKAKWGAPFPSMVVVFKPKSI